MLGFYELTVTTAQASGGEATRVVIAGEMRDDEQGFELLGAPWVYAFDGLQAGTQRRVLADPESGYQSEHGAFVLNRPFAAALLNNTTVEFSSPLPIKNSLGRKGVATFVNEALARIWVEARLTLTGNGTNQYDFAAYPTVELYEQMRGISDTDTLGAAYAPELTGRPYRLVKNGVTRTLVVNTIYSTSQTFYLDVIVRGDRLIYDGSAWSYVTTPGLLQDTWQAAAREEWVLAFGMRQALGHISQIVRADRTLSKEEKDGILYGPDGVVAKRRQWSWACYRIVTEEFPKPLQEYEDSRFGLAYEMAAWD